MKTLPKKTKLSPGLLNLLNDSTSKKVLSVPQNDGTDYPCALKHLALSDTGSLLVGLENEHSELGRGLVRGLWFEQPVTLWLTENDTTYRVDICPWRCLICGPLFAKTLKTARSLDPEADFTAVWELYPVHVETVNSPGPAPLPVHITGETEHHLDHPSLHR